jgi:hypothetical protein
MLRSSLRMPGEQLIGDGAAIWGGLDQDAASVTGVGGAADPAAVFEKVERCGHGGRCDEEPFADLRGGQRRPGPVDDGQGRGGSLGHVKGQGDAPVKLAQEGLASTAQAGVCLRAGDVAVGILRGEIGIDLDHSLGAWVQTSVKMSIRGAPSTPACSIPARSAGS